MQIYKLFIETTSKLRDYFFRKPCDYVFCEEQVSCIPSHHGHETVSLLSLYDEKTVLLLYPKDLSSDPLGYTNHGIFIRIQEFNIG